MRKARKNYFIYLMMLLIFGGLIYTAIAGGERFLHLSSIKPATAGDDAFTMFKTILLDNLEHPFSILLIQIIVFHIIRGCHVVLPMRRMHPYRYVLFCDRTSS